MTTTNKQLLTTPVDKSVDNSTPKRKHSRRAPETKPPLSATAGISNNNDIQIKQSLSTGIVPLHDKSDQLLALQFNRTVLISLIQQFFDEKHAAKKPLTVSGLCLALGISWRDLQKLRQETAPSAEIIKRAYLIIMDDYESRLATQQLTGAIFGLKCMDREQWNDGQHGGGDGTSGYADVTITLPGKGQLRVSCGKGAVKNKPLAPLLDGK